MLKLTRSSTATIGEEQVKGFFDVFKFKEIKVVPITKPNPAKPAKTKPQAQQPPASTKVASTPTQAKAKTKAQTQAQQPPASPKVAATPTQTQQPQVSAQEIPTPTQAKTQQPPVSAQMAPVPAATKEKNVAHTQDKLTFINHDGVLTSCFCMESADKKPILSFTNNQKHRPTG